MARSVNTGTDSAILINPVSIIYYVGLSAELYYIREGVINEYALNFVVPVPAHIQDLFFTWQAIGEKPVSILMFYFNTVFKSECHGR